jgi:hypothetical protein
VVTNLLKPCVSLGACANTGTRKLLRGKKKTWVVNIHGRLSCIIVCACADKQQEEFARLEEEMWKPPRTREVTGISEDLSALPWDFEPTPGRRTCYIHATGNAGKWPR